MHSLEMLLVEIIQNSESKENSDDNEPKGE